MRADAAAAPSGDPGRRGTDSVEVLFRARHSEFVALAVTFTRDLGEAEEVVQDAFAAVIARSRPLDDESKLGGYVAQAVVNGARSRLRRRAVEERPRPVDLTLVHRAPAQPTDESTVVLEAVMALPERQAQCVVCRYLLDMKYRDVASTLGISQASARTHVRRAMARLADVMKEDR